LKIREKYATLTPEFPTAYKPKASDNEPTSPVKDPVHENVLCLT
jgi:hypothetical protein